MLLSGSLKYLGNETPKTPKAVRCAGASILWRCASEACIRHTPIFTADPEMSGAVRCASESKLRCASEVKGAQVSQVQVRKFWVRK